MAGGSKKVVVAALVANFGIAVAKFGGATYTGSSAMLSEGVHSLVDTSNQGLLLLGMSRSTRAPDDRHPFGYSREIYFWSFVVAVLLFGAGGAVAIYEGISKIIAPHPVDNPVVNYIILGVAIVLELGSFWVALKEFRAVAAGRHWWAAVTEAKDPVLYTVLFEDTAALLGLVVALVGLFLAEALGIPALDGVASVVIGVILVVASLILAKETMGLIIGEAAAPEVLDDIERIIAAGEGVTGVRDLHTSHLGPHDIIVTAAVDFDDALTAGDVERIARDVSARVQAAQPDVKRVFFAPTSLTA